MIVDHAAAIDQPRSTSIEGPKLTIMAKQTLNMPQIRPAAIHGEDAALDKAQGPSSLQGCRWTRRRPMTGWRVT